MGAEGPTTTGERLLFVGALAVIGGILAAKALMAALGVALLGVVVGVRLLLGYVLRRIHVTATAPLTASEGDRVVAVVTVENRSRIPVFFVRVGYLFGPEAAAQRVLMLTRRIDPLRRVEQEVALRCRRPRGIYATGPAQITIADPFGWFSVQKRLAPGGTTKVYPRMLDRSLPDRMMNAIGQADLVHRRARAMDSDEFRSVREYLPGDPLKRVHWPLTARRGYPVVREYLPRTPESLVLTLDIGRATRLSGANLDGFESSIRLLASLGARATRSGFRIELRCGGDAAFDVPPGVGAPQLMRILERLIRVRTPGSDDYAATLRRATGGGVVFVTLHQHAMNGSAVEGQIRQLLGRGIRVVCVAYRLPPEFMAEGMQERRAACLRRLCDAGAEIFDERGRPVGRAMAASA